MLLQHLQGLAAQTGTDTGLNVVAYTGNVKDAIVAAILETSFEEHTVLCMVADGMSRQQQLHAELTADLLGGRPNDMLKSCYCKHICSGCNAHVPAIELSCSAPVFAGIELWQVSAETDSQGPVEAVAASLGSASDCVLFCGASASDMRAGLSAGGVKTLLQDLNDGVIDQLTKVGWQSSLHIMCAHVASRSTATHVIPYCPCFSYVCAGTWPAAAVQQHVPRHGEP